MNGGTRWVAWAAYAAAAWALIFAAPHFWWALGVSWAFPGDAEVFERAFDRTWWLVYDLVVGLLCLVGAGVVLALVQPWGRALPTRFARLVRPAAWSGSVLLLLRGALGVASMLWSLLSGASDEFHPWSYVIEPWFLVGGILFGLAACFSRRGPYADAPV
ncbi:MAG: DUF3995 domain-containing protein [Chloroflexia bacterium]|nr:DUF3995 domain-containing protein [Chloroflexia bacterium]